MEIINSVLDGNIEEQTIALKAFFGLRPEQSFQEIEISNEDIEAVEDDS